MGELHGGKASFYTIATRRQSRAQWALAFAASQWPVVAVFGSLALSNAFGVVPGTCIGPAPVGRGSPALERPQQQEARGTAPLMRAEGAPEQEKTVPWQETKGYG